MRICKLLPSAEAEKPLFLEQEGPPAPCLLVETAPLLSPWSCGMEMSPDSPPQQDTSSLESRRGLAPARGVGVPAVSHPLLSDGQHMEQRIQAPCISDCPLCPSSSQF